MKNKSIPFHFFLSSHTLRSFCAFVLHRREREYKCIVAKYHRYSKNKHTMSQFTRLFRTFCFTLPLAKATKSSGFHPLLCQTKPISRFWCETDMEMVYVVFERGFHFFLAQMHFLHFASKKCCWQKSEILFISRFVCLACFCFTIISNVHIKFMQFQIRVFLNFLWYSLSRVSFLFGMNRTHLNLKLFLINFLDKFF